MRGRVAAASSQLARLLALASPRLLDAAARVSWELLGFALMRCACFRTSTVIALFRTCEQNLCKTWGRIGAVSLLAENLTDSFGFQQR